MPNPLVPQGTINRVRGSIIWPAFPQLTVTAPYLGRDGISIAFEGETVVYLPTMTGAVTSLEPFVMATIRINLLKSQAFADLFKQQVELQSNVGDCTIRPDSSELSPYQFLNTSLNNPGELKFNGEEATFPLTAKGYYLVNSALFDT